MEANLLYVLQNVTKSDDEILVVMYSIMNPNYYDIGLKEVGKPYKEYLVKELIKKGKLTIQESKILGYLNIFEHYDVQLEKNVDPDADKTIGTLIKEGKLTLKEAVIISYLDAFERFVSALKRRIKDVYLKLYWGIGASKFIIFKGGLPKSLIQWGALNNVRILNKDIDLCYKLFRELIIDMRKVYAPTFYGFFATRSPEEFHVKYPQFGNNIIETTFYVPTEDD